MFWLSLLEVKWLCWVQGHSAQPSLPPPFVERLQSWTKQKNYQVEAFLLLRDIEMVDILYDRKSWLQYILIEMWKYKPAKTPPPEISLIGKIKTIYFFILLKETYSLSISKYLEDNAITQTPAVFHPHIGTLGHTNTRILLYAEVHMLPVKCYCFLLFLSKVLTPTCSFKQSFLIS